jgi:hypothetical protein
LTSSGGGQSADLVLTKLPFYTALSAEHNSVYIA